MKQTINKSNAFNNNNNNIADNVYGAVIMT